MKHLFKDVGPWPDPVAVVAVQCLVDDGFLPGRLDGSKGHKAVEFFVAKVAVVVGH